jgi:calcium-translocating P-type ATPase
MNIHETPHSIEVRHLIDHYVSDEKSGLSQEEAAKRIREFGPNQLISKKERSWLSNFFVQFMNPLVYLLVAAAVIVFFLGRTSDPFVILGVVVFNAILGAVQEGKAERALSALVKLAKVQARVIRDGREQRVEAFELVPGDIIHLAAGDAVPADARIIQAMSLEVIESALTGESEAIAKIEEKISQGTILAERKNMLYTGTFVSRGRCVAIVVATGQKTEIGKISQEAEKGKGIKTPIEKRIAKFTQHLCIAAVVVFCLLVGMGFLRGMPLSEIFMAAISQLVSLIPEGLPAAITIALAVGVQRMSKNGAIVRRLVAVETLGSTTVICTDKTGTLTRGEMTASAVFLPNQPLIHIEEEFVQAKKTIVPEDNNAFMVLLEAAVLCNDAKLEAKNSSWQILGDPMEGALILLARKAEIDDQAMVQEIPRRGEIPFDSSTKMMATLHEGVVMVKGGIEQILGLCRTVLIDDEERELTHKIRQGIEDEANEMAKQGLRLLAFARVEDESNSVSAISDITGRALFLGFVALFDPPRQEAFHAVKVCKEAGIRPIMVTGDHLVTAKAIAKQLEILSDHDEAIDGVELDSLSQDDLLRRIKTISVFARLHPAQKLRIVKALQAQGEIVAMTGDGANDAPALACADVGVAMGITGTDVAKEAAKMVITDDHFATIVKAVEQGRLVFNNIKKVIFYLIATNFSAALTLLIAVSFGFPLPLAAVQILWINVVTEGTVTVNLILDPPEGDEMRRPPTRIGDHIFSRTTVIRLIYTSLIITTLMLVYFFYLWGMKVNLTLIQTEMFTLLAFCAWFKVLSTRSERRSCFQMNLFGNPYLTFGLLASIFLQAMVIYIPSLNDVFHTTPLSFKQVIVLLAIGSLVLWIDEARKWFSRA